MYAKRNNYLQGNRGLAGNLFADSCADSVSGIVLRAVVLEHKSLVKPRFVCWLVLLRPRRMNSVGLVSWQHKRTRHSALEQTVWNSTSRFRFGQCVRKSSEEARSVHGIRTLDGLWSNLFVIVQTDYADIRAVVQRGKCVNECLDAGIGIELIVQARRMHKLWMETSNASRLAVGKV